MDGFKRFLTNRLTWASAAAIVAFCITASLAPIDLLAEGWRTALVTLSFMGLPVYSRVAVEAYKAHRWPNEALLAALAMCLMLGGLGVGGLFSLLWRLSNFDNDIVTNVFFVATVAMVAAGVFILVVTPNLFGRGVPRGMQVRLGVTWILAIVVIVGLTVASPDLRWLANDLRPALVGRHAPPG